MWIFFFMFPDENVKKKCCINKVAPHSLPPPPFPAEKPDPRRPHTALLEPRWREAGERRAFRRGCADGRREIASETGRESENSRDKHRRGTQLSITATPALMKVLVLTATAGLKLVPGRPTLVLGCRGTPTSSFP